MRCPPRSPRVSTCGATSPGRCSTTSSGRTGTRSASAWCTWTSPRSSARSSAAGSSTRASRAATAPRAASPSSPAVLDSDSWHPQRDGGLVRRRSSPAARRQRDRLRLAELEGIERAGAREVRAEAIAQIAPHARLPAGLERGIAAEADLIEVRVLTNPQWQAHAAAAAPAFERDVVALDAEDQREELGILLLAGRDLPVPEVKCQRADQLEARAEPPPDLSLLRGSAEHGIGLDRHRGRGLERAAVAPDADSTPAAIGKAHRTGATLRPSQRAGEEGPALVHFHRRGLLAPIVVADSHTGFELRVRLRDGAE